MLACSSRDEARPGTLHRDEVFDHAGTQRTYHLYETAEPGPTVLLLHGGFATIDNHIGLDSASWPHQVWLDIADTDGLDVLVPQGLDRHWNDCRAACERCGQEDDLGFLLALLDHTGAAEVWVVGESNGGFMTLRLAEEAPDRIAAAGVVIAAMPAESDCTPLNQPVPMMFQVGTEDAAVLYEGGASDPELGVLSAADTAAYWGERNGCTGEPSRTTLDDLDPDDQSTVVREDYSCSEAPLSVLTMEGAGHVPPSIEVQVSAVWEGIAGIQNHDVEGARAFYAFFSEL